jgi:hypothetical protein
LFAVALASALAIFHFSQMKYKIPIQDFPVFHTPLRMKKDASEAITPLLKYASSGQLHCAPEEFAP